jgi:MFS transporter, DHA1 family, multidrug resistance protein
VPAPATPALLTSATRLATSHYFLAGFGYIALLSTLVLSLQAKGFDPTTLSVLFTLFTAANRLAKLPLAPWLDPLPPTRAIGLGCATVAVSVAALAATIDVFAVAGLLALCAVGTSINALASKQLAAAVVDIGAPRLELFSRLSAVGNFAAAISAPVATWLLQTSGTNALALLIAMSYTVTGVVTAWRGSRLVSDYGAQRTVSYFGRVRAVITQPGLIRFLIVNAMGWSLYYQLFSVLPLLVSSQTETAPLMGLLLTVNTMMVAVLQVNVSRFTERRLLTETRLIALGYGVFAAGFFSLVFGTSLATLLVFIVLVTVAEMLFVPAVDAAFVSLIAGGNRAVGFALLSMSTAIGESAGALIGINAYTATVKDAPAAYWLGLTGVAAIFAATAHRMGQGLLPEREGRNAE